MTQVKEEDVINLMIQNEELRQKIYDKNAEKMKQNQLKNQNAPEIEKISGKDKIRYSNIRISVIPPPFEM